jgi:hypothetical protein
LRGVALVILKSPNSMTKGQICGVMVVVCGETAVSCPKTYLNSILNSGKSIINNFVCQVQLIG